MKWYYWALIAVVVIGIGYVLIKKTKSQAVVVQNAGVGTGFNPYELIKIV